MNSKEKILIFIDMEMILRHFIANDTFKELDKNYDLVYVFNYDRYDFKNDKIVKEFILKDKIRITNIPRSRTGKWFYLYIVTVLRQQRGTKNFQARIRQEFSRIGKKNVILALIAGLPFIYQIFHFLFVRKMGIHSNVTEIIKKEKPKAIIHPSILQGYFVNELIRYRVTKDNSIPLIFLMNSWDNPSAKAFCTGAPTKLVVWGEQSKNHAIEYMKLNPKDIECFGAAQFEIYKEKTRLSREELCQFFNVDNEKTIILYAGAGNGKYESLYLESLESFIRDGFLPNCHIIYRPHPWRGGLGDGEKDFFKMDFHNITIDPTMSDYYRKEIKNPSGKMFLTDYRNSRDLLTLVDGVISPLSTMLVESIINGKPILMFFPERQYDSGYAIDEIHFAEFLKVNIINKCLKEDQFLKSCQTLLKQIEGDDISLELKKTSEFFVTPSKISYGEQLLKLVEKLTFRK